MPSSTSAASVTLTALGGIYETSPTHHGHIWHSLLPVTQHMISLTHPVARSSASARPTFDVYTVSNTGQGDLKLTKFPQWNRKTHMREDSGPYPSPCDSPRQWSRIYSLHPLIAMCFPTGLPEGCPGCFDQTRPKGRTLGHRLRAAEIDDAVELAQLVCTRVQREAIKEPSVRCDEMGTIDLGPCSPGGQGSRL